MISFFLGVFVIGFKIPRPGAISRARFLQVGRMYMIIFLLLDNPVVRRVLSEEEVQEVEIMAPYVALHYLPFMLKALYAPSAPRNLITAIQRLRRIRLECPVVAAAALQKREFHLNFLSGELVIFYLFDTKLGLLKIAKTAAINIFLNI